MGKVAEGSVPLVAVSTRATKSIHLSCSEGIIVGSQTSVSSAAFDLVIIVDMRASGWGALAAL